MLRILRAFAWMRWRVLVNSLERTGARDTLERFSIALEQIAPLVALVLLAPSAVAAGAFGAASGYALAGNPDTPLIEVLRNLLFVAVLFSLAGPLAFPAAERTNAVRLSLLPISRPTLYVAQTASALADPWILLAAPLMLLVPVGLAAAGALGAAAIALAAGTLLLAALVGITSLAASLLQLVVRNRRRGELLALFFVLVLPVIVMLPALYEADAGEGSDPAKADGRERAGWVKTISHVRPYIPSELYVVTVSRSASLGAPASTGPLAAMAVAAVALHALGLMVYARLIGSPSGGGGGRRLVRSARWISVPGVAAGTSAVALAQVRLAIRTPRGRFMLLSPLILLVMFGAMMSRGGDMRFAFIALESGIGLATFGAFWALMSILPLSMNQFAVDRAGLTLALLSPLSDRELLAGKAIGNGLIVAGTALVCVAGALLAFPGGSPWLWMSIPLSLAATYVLVTPAAAALSAVFPRTVDMNSIGRGSNAHGIAALLGFLAFAAAAAPCALMVAVATRVLAQPALAPLFLLAWLGISAGLAAALFIPVRKLFARRRENLGMVV